MSRGKIPVKENVIEIESIDAFPDTPAIDLKNWLDRVPWGRFEYLSRPCSGHAVQPAGDTSQ